MGTRVGVKCCAANSNLPPRRADPHAGGKNMLGWSLVPISGRSRVDLGPRRVKTLWDKNPPADEYLGGLSGRSRAISGNLGSISVRCQVDLGFISGQSRVDLGSISGRSRVSLGSISGRSRVGLGSVSGRSRVDLWSCMLCSPRVMVRRLIYNTDT